MLYSIFTDDIKTNIDLIDKIKNFLLKQYATIDFVVFTNNISYGISNNAILTIFYMIAYNGTIIFLNFDDYLQYKDSTTNAIIYMTQEDASHIDRSSIKGCKILTEINNELEWIKNYEL